MNINKLFTEFQSIFQTSHQPVTFFAPGRINLIGEHTDYNGGNVFPAAISFGTYALARKRHDQLLRFYSLNFSEKGIIECELNELEYDSNHDWANYPKGMIQALKQQGHSVSSGMDILYYGNIPNGAGLSSSASIEMVTGVMLEELFDLDIERLAMIQLGQQVENNYIGVNSGIMDQFAIGMGKKNHAMLLDCQTLDFQYAPVELEDHIIMIMNTNKQRTLAGSKYNERREQCEAALGDLQSELAINSLGDLTNEQFEKYQHLIKDEVNCKRARHAVTENQRTLKALDELHAGNLTEFGRLMDASHQSLKEDYEVTGMELDTLVAAAREQEGVLGARMTGAGFGGCAIAIVEKAHQEAFRDQVNAIYRGKIGYDATFYPASISDGAKKVDDVESVPAAE
ncbi:galactokinase [Virgibacillus halodenitrificans]|uniref:Galactokinase n=1 Tax=Virgibacillus halodenitrificans TaxID=1482 RepID=A0ABR7VHD6_VIRHA|nr:galactokinase [Virgibacillus halodenitrificans]MBD1221352.1 galactokinase [Virgibacillus halodenitrificans]